MTRGIGRIRTGQFVGLVCLALSSVSTLRAIERKPLPAFQVFSASGAAISSQQLSRQPKWLIIYGTTRCPACDRLLDAIKSWQSVLFQSRVVLLVGGDPTLVPAYIAGRRQNDPYALPAFADTQGQAWQTLALSSSPVIIGIQAGRIEWSLEGVLNDPGAVEPVLKAWVEY